MFAYAAIDPLALIFPTRIYLMIVEKLHPNEPALAVVKAAAQHLNAEERAAVVANAQRLVEYGNAVIGAVGAAR